MIAKRWRSVCGPIVAAVLMSPMFVGCGAAKGLAGGACGIDLKSPDTIMQAQFGLKAEAEGKVKAALAAVANLEGLAVEVEGKVALACGNLAKSLGATDDQLAPADDKPGAKAKAACGVAVKLIGEAKAKASGKLKVDFEAPKCSASMDAYANCAGKCDANVKGPEAEVKCEGGEISGKCGAECKGKCTAEAGAKCAGTCSGNCSGACSANFSGKCDGTCKGKCDGKDSTAKCAGKCEGTCEGGKGEGTCGGKCDGTCSATCQMEAKGKCEGTCTGECSVKMEAPKCSGEVKPPEMSAECKASCDAEVSAKVECTPARVVVKIEGAADAQAATKLVAALEANLPALLEVTIGMKDTIAKASASVKTAIDGAMAAKGELTGGAAPNVAMKVGACLGAQIQAMVGVQASLNVSVEASASASGSASAG